MKTPALWLPAFVAFALAGSSAHAQVSGSGTPGTLPVWAGDGTMLTDSLIQSGTTVNVNAPLQVNGGVVGTSNGPGAGVFGTSPSSDGVIGVTTSTTFGNGVSGRSSAPTTNGVYGEATSTTGFAAGVIGVTASGQGTGVSGFNNSTTGGSAVYAEAMATTNYAAGVTAVVHSPNGNGVTGLNMADTGGDGVLGEAKATQGYAQGVFGIAHGSLGVGVAGDGPLEGVLGWSADCDSTGCHAVAGIGGQFTTAPGGTILSGSVALASDNWMRTFRVDSTGQVFANGGYQTGGADFAESMAVTGERSRYEPGDVVVIEESGNRQVGLAHDAYSTLVAGIYSTKPGVLATPYTMDDPRLLKEIPLAVVGIVPCKVTAENGAIKTGDLLVTSTAPGHAMKGTDRSRMLGAVVGKALEPLAAGRGVIQVLVTLQ